ncbi:growth hormone secretagogue receptor type 1-like [Macrobrachium rosenbergii]|uniref:growth hormone secretagogue receptor type 1-like n=1 Tax=Macrobrachium rosenbergii TaxID=79674 RepID=UPI0034D4D266
MAFAVPLGAMEFRAEVVTTNPAVECGSEDCTTASILHQVRSSHILNGTVLPDVGTPFLWNTSSVYSEDRWPNITFPAYMKGIYTAWCLLLLPVGLVGNILVPVVVMKDRDLRATSTSVFIMNLVVADLLVLIICLPALLSELYAPPAIWVLPESMCKVVPYIEFTVAHASMLTILAISVERYRVICHPLTAAANCSRARAVGACVLVWVIATVVTSPIIVLTKYNHVPYIDHSVVPVCYTSVDKPMEKLFVISAMVLLFFLPLLVLIVLYWRIARQLLLEDKELCKDKPNPNLQARKQVVVMLGTVVAVFFVCLLPHRVFCLWVITTSLETETSIGEETYYNMLYAFRILVYVNSTINPLLYNLTSSKFRGAFLRLIGSRRGEYLVSSVVHRTTSQTLSSSINKQSVSWRGQRLLVRCSYTCLEGEGEMRPLVDRMPLESPWAHTNGAHYRSPSTSPSRSPFLQRTPCVKEEGEKDTESFV